MRAAEGGGSDDDLNLLSLSLWACSRRVIALLFAQKHACDLVLALSTTLNEASSKRDKDQRRFARVDQFFKMRNSTSLPLSSLQNSKNQSP
jgi:hypothetical protein